MPFFDLRTFEFNISIVIVVTLILCCSTKEAKGQSAFQNSERFHLGVVLGANLAQIDGDPYKGYRKWGLQSGLEGYVSLKKNKELSLGVLFNQIGSYPSITERKRDGDNFLDFRLTYLDVPLVLHFLSGEKETHYTTDIQVGISISRLISSRIVSKRILTGGVPEELGPFFGVVDQQETFRNFTPNLIVGIARYFSPNWGISLRHTLSINSFFEPMDMDEQLEGLSSFYFSLGINYKIR